MDISLRDSDQWELLCSLFSILEDYYQHYESLTTKKRKPEKQDLGYETRANKRVKQNSENEGPTEYSFAPTPSYQPGPTLRSQKNSTTDRVNHGIPPQYGQEPVLFPYENCLSRTTLPIPGVEIDKMDLARQYAYIDQLIMELSLIAGNAPDYGKSLLTVPKKEFLKKLQTDIIPRSEFLRLTRQFPLTMRNAVFNEGNSDFLSYFCREGMTTAKPYLTEQMRDNLKLFEDENIPDLLQGDILHVPFSENEKRIINCYSDPSQKINQIIGQLPGRTGVDILRYIGERDYKLSLPDSKEDPVTTPITYTPKENRSRSTFQNQLTTVMDRQYASNTSLLPSQKKICRSLLSSLQLVGVSSAPTEAVVDCKLDPTGKSYRIIVGTARNETTNATNVSVLYDAEAGTINCLTEHTDTVSASDFSIDGELIITASYDKNIIVRKASDGAVVRYLGKQEGRPIVQHKDKILNMVLHKSNRQILSTFSFKEILLWNIDTGEMVSELTKNLTMSGDVVDMTFSSGKYSNLLIVGSEAPNNRGELRIWDTYTGQMLYSGFEARGMISSVACDKGDSVVAATRMLVRQFDIRSPDETVALFKTGQKDVNIVSYSPCGRFLQTSGTDNRCIVFDRRYPDRPLHVLDHLPPPTPEIADTVGVNSAIWTHDGNFIVTGGEDGFVRVWDIACGNPLINALESKSPICACDISQNFDMIVAGDEAATIKLWSIKGGHFTMNDEDLISVGRGNNREERNIRDIVTELDSLGALQPLAVSRTEQEGEQELVYFDLTFSEEESGFDESSSDVEMHEQ